MFCDELEILGIEFFQQALFVGEKEGSAPRREHLCQVFQELTVEGFVFGMTAHPQPEGHIADDLIKPLPIGGHSVLHDKTGSRLGLLFVQVGRLDGIGGNVPTDQRLIRVLGPLKQHGPRTAETVKDMGIPLTRNCRCILGTIAVKDFDFTARMAQKYGDQIAVGVDARDGYVAINGWKELSAETGIEFCRRLRDAGVKTVIYTDISRDGAEKGTNLELYRELAKIEGLNITASGGVSSMEDVKELQTIGTHAAILGKALYTGRLDLKTVIDEVG